ncbi:MAG: response regulator transcription factor [Sphingomonas sp.]|nr:response regulator transcription factor [Sphingomonas sp.]
MRVLLIEDDEEIAGYIEQGLVEMRHAVNRAANGRDGLRLGLTEEFDAIVLDRMLPGIEGIDVVRRLRAAEIDTPILVLTAKGGVADRVDGLNDGADDYLVKPFAFSELLARLTAVMRRRPANEPVMRLDVGDVAMDLIRREVTRAGKQLPLQPREFAMMELLMRNGGNVVTRAMFLEHVWGCDFDPQTNIVDSNLSRLRSKLREGFADDPIETVRGEGYRMRANA